MQNGIENNEAEQEQLDVDGDFKSLCLSKENLVVVLKHIRHWSISPDKSNVKEKKRNTCEIHTPMSQNITTCPNDVEF